MDALLEEWIDRVRSASSRREALRIRAGGTKDFYGNTPRGAVFDPRGWSGVESYEPSELVITARGGTPLALIQERLAAQRQMLAFEPPHFGAGATLGGCIAAGLSGPRRTAAGYTYGSLRDAVLGARLLDGQGRLLRFGGTVIKNVAGYDVSRLLAGSLGILGVIVDVSLKVLPMPAMERSLRFSMSEQAALENLQQWGGEPLPLSASCWLENTLWLRLSGAAPAVEVASRALGGEVIDDDVAAGFWHDVREQRHAWFDGKSPLWRVSLPCTAEPVAIDSPQLIEWGGALRWLRSEAPAAQIRALAHELGGHATLFRSGEQREHAFTPLSAPLLAIHQRLKQEFDPARIFNPGRLYAEL
ncbi:MAG TPA: glycolate oxidase subunit GlcE [Steroidobacteraceae bacterium]|nr:glycolate oxidase subunit GlcE [Steroidobacteraceae bacterium]